MRHITLLAISTTIALGASAAACSSAVEQSSSTSTGSGGKATTSTSDGSGGMTTSTGTPTSTGSNTTTTTGSNTTTTTTVSSTSSSTSGGMCPSGNPSANYPGPRPADPQVQGFGGPVLAAPKIIPIYFSNDDAAFTSQITDFVQKIGGTTYWTATTSEYGVGAATAGTPIQLAEASPNNTTDKQIEQWLTTKLQSDPNFPAPDANTLYAIFYPSNTVISQNTGMGTATSCKEFGGYHENITFNGKDVALAVMPRCNFGMGDLQTTTSSASHEFIEAATDPYPFTSPGFAQPDEAHLYYQLLLGGGEVGDMCAQNPGAFGDFAGIGYTVQRTWSNKAVAAGHDPCQPSQGVYSAAVPVLPDTFNAMGAMIKGVGVPPNGKTIDIDFYSDGDTGGPVPVQVVDASMFVGAQLDSLNLSLDCNQAQNGQKLHLTIQVAQKGQSGFGAFFLVTGADQHALVPGLTVAM